MEPSAEESFTARLRTAARALHPWARRERIGAYRLYDRDLDAAPVTVDWYAGHLHVSVFAGGAPDTPSAGAPERWGELAGAALDVPPDRVFVKRRFRQTRRRQYERRDEHPAGERGRLVVREGSLRFHVSLADYVDTGLFLDHRLTRAMVAADADGRDVLNLFCYTGAFTVAAAVGGARSTTSVDLSSTYLRWAQRNLTLNERWGPRHRLVRADVRAFVRDPLRALERYDLIVLDPPTFSRSKRTAADFELQRDHRELVERLVALLRPGGALLLAATAPSFRLDVGDVAGIAVDEITEPTRPRDFRSRPLRRCWRIVREATAAPTAPSSAAAGSPVAAAPRAEAELYATCDAGLETALADELRALGAEAVRPGVRGVAFRGERELLWHVALASRLASRVLVRIASFRARDRRRLYAGAVRVDWEAVLGPDQTLAVDVTGRSRHFDHFGFVALVVKDAICDHLRERHGRRPDVDRRRPDVPVNVHLEGDRCTLHLDAAGARLHRRGYRVEGGPAPLKETLAAGVLRLAGWEPGTPLVDPMCGSGTFLIEAALVAAGVAPGLLRLSRGGEGFAFQRWRSHDAAEFARLVADLERARRPAPDAVLVGFDRDRRALRAARRNAERAGVAERVRFAVRELSDVRPATERGLVVTNPPWGKRIGAAGGLEALYCRLGDLLKEHFAGHTAWVLVGDPELAKRIGLRAARRVVVHDGPVACRLLGFELYAGSRRRDVGEGSGDGGTS